MRKKPINILFLLCVILSVWSLSQAEIIFVDASLANTTINGVAPASGVTIEDAASGSIANLWNHRNVGYLGYGDFIWESYNPEDCAPLVVSMTLPTPGTYKIYALANLGGSYDIAVSLDGGATYEIGTADNSYYEGSYSVSTNFGISEAGKYMSLFTVGTVKTTTSNQELLVYVDDFLRGTGSDERTSFDGLGYELTYELTPYEVWSASYNLAGEDDDRDGLSNLAEFALAGNPTNPAENGQVPLFGMDGSNFFYVYPHRTEAGMVYWLETTTNLASGSWDTFDYVQLPGAATFGSGFGAISNNFPALMDQAFIRLCVEEDLPYNEYHVSIQGSDENEGSALHPFRTISAAAQVAQPGDTVTVHEGIYRERVNPPRGGSSDDQRITYQAAPGEQVIIKGSEVVTGWEQVDGDLWTVALPNSFFGDFNPFDDLISGDWFDDLGRDHHTGAVYLNGDWLIEAKTLAAVLNPELTETSYGVLFNVAWIRTLGVQETTIPAADFIENHGVGIASSSEGGECIGWIEEDDWVTYSIDFGDATEHMEFRVASPSSGGIIEIRLDSPQGNLIGTCTVPVTFGWQSWTTVQTPILPTSGQQTLCLLFKNPIDPPAEDFVWFAQVDEQNTTIWARFNGVDPNPELVEVNARQSVFYPDNPGVDYITVRGFTMEQAATPWAPPTAEQIGLVGTHWSKGWIIEDNVIRYSTCVGVTLGKYGDEFDNLAGSADGYNGTIERALTNGWNKQTIGSHVVRNNHISNCEQAGIVGSLGAIFSKISGNTIHDIYVHKLFSGAEMGGIKFHAAIDLLIEGNHIYRCGRSGGIWLDWMAQGTRITGNLLHDNWANADLFVEVNHGPFLVDNNIFLSTSSLRDWSQGGAYVHNIFGGTSQMEVVLPQGRETPFHYAHSTMIAGLSSIPGGDDRFINNLFLNSGNLDVYEAVASSMMIDGNAFLDSSVQLITNEEGVFLNLPAVTADGEVRSVVTSALLGSTAVSAQPYQQPDGTPYRIDTDYFGNMREGVNPTPGPFESLGADPNIRQVWPIQGNAQ